MPLTEIFANVSLNQAIGAGAGLVIAGGLHFTKKMCDHLLDTLLNTASELLDGAASALSTTLGGEAPRTTPEPQPQTSAQIPSNARGRIMTVVFYAATAAAGFAIATKIESPAAGQPVKVAPATTEVTPRP